MATKRKKIKDVVIDQILNEHFDSKREKINYLKKISKELKTNEELRNEIKREFDAGNPVQETYSKAKSILNRRYNGFTSTLFLAFVTLLASVSSLFYVLLNIGYFD